MVKPAAAGTKNPPQTKGKQRIEIKYIEDKEKRQVTFSKRKGGLLKKASELHLLCGAHVALVIFSQAANPCPAALAAAARLTSGKRAASSSSTSRSRGGGNVFAMGTPSVDHVMSRLAAAGADPYGHRTAALQEDVVVGAGREVAEATALRRDQARGLVDAEGRRMKAVAAKVMEATPEGRFWWEADVAALGEADLPEFGGALRRLRDNVMRRHADKLVPAQ